ncbi:glycosyltransferase [Chitinophaga sp. 22620]|uniref:glycosyltransferase n=1 Tax=Chitinophaga sp. 22620 TaxID=3453952 RepID=UPI003F83FCB8
MMEPLEPVSPPSRLELFTLRLMIVLGVLSMGVLLYSLLRSTQVGYEPFYWVLMAGIAFNCLAILHEWYHYFSITIPPAPPQQYPFTVDVLTTYFPGEPYDMIVNTLTAIQAMPYPHTAYLCDEGDDLYLKEVCERLGVRHVTRSDRRDAKAGNINNALRYATGELCVVLDPDHVPAPGFLDAVVAYFNDPAIGFVQIVQAYSNLGDSLVAKGAAQQTFQFYGPIMSTMNRYGTVQAIGANCTFRRAALDSIGGHASGLAEDMHTAMHLHARGWKSVYVPIVLTRGLVPNTLSAYYAQQLKWARGTFELLVTSYPRLFRKFTWAQRLHYGTIPFHYFSGIIILINFLIPVLSLVTGLIPFRADVLNLAMLAFPAIASILLIRHFVQRWVMEETERGFHVVGGLLFIGTWWIYILGLVYTLARKKVPYIPTPKDDSGPDDWRLNLPNIAVIVVSVAAIVYGLHYDWNPYSLFMAGIAGLNCLIMMFNILASLRLHNIPARYSWVNTMLIVPLLLKRQFWLFRHLHLYAGVRKLGLPLLLAVIFLSWHFTRGGSEPGTPSHAKRGQEQPFYTGIYDPEQRQGIANPGIVSLYIPWGDGPQSLLPDSLAAEIYRQGAIPMITWEPWANLFKNTTEELEKEQKIFAHITAGMFDHYLAQFADQVKALNRPVFLRFAHEPDNPAYPWSARGGNTPEEFKAAWRYVHDVFQRRGAFNAIWVWNPWKAEAAEAYFPGKGTVDWIGLTILNYGPYQQDGQSYSFETLYAPFRRLPLLRSGLPVMIAETGSLSAAGGQDQWLHNALKAVNDSFPEIHALVFFNTSHDKNVPPGISVPSLDWSIQNRQQLLASLDSFPRLRQHTAAYSGALNDALPANTFPHRALPDSIRGLSYQKGESWFRNLHAVTRREAARNMQSMKQLGVNTIRRYGPGVYDRNILAEAQLNGLNIHYGFWIPAITGMDKDAETLSELERNILRTVRKHRGDSVITAWSIGNNAWQQLARHHYKPGLLYQQKEYISWLADLTAAIKAIDSSRPLTLDMHLKPGITASLQWLRPQLPAVDAFGIEAGADTSGLAELLASGIPCFISRMPVKTYAALPPAMRQPAFVTTWQDLETRDFVTFNGITDHLGRYKPDWYQLAGVWGQAVPPALPRVKILRPSRTTLPGSRLTYHALVKEGSGWAFANNMHTGLRYEWYLVKTDRYGYPIFIEKAGEGPSITLDVPGNALQYRLYLEAVKDSSVSTSMNTLHTPFY